MRIVHVAMTRTVLALCLVGAPERERDRGMMALSSKAAGYHVVYPQPATGD